jgi:hypothetical protein
LLTHHLDFSFPRDHRAHRPRLDRNHPRARMNAGARRHRRDEAEFVRAVIHHVAKPRDSPVVSHFERRQEAEREESMRDRPAKRTFLFASFDVDMNPLMVAGHVGELIDFFLGDMNRFAPRTKLFADLRGECRHVVKFYCLHRSYSPMFR